MILLQWMGFIYSGILSANFWSVYLCQCSAAYLKAASFGRVQDQELFKQVLTVSGHVEGNPVFTTQHTFSQFLQMEEYIESKQLMHVYVQKTTVSSVFCYSSPFKINWLKTFAVVAPQVNNIF